VQRLDGSYSNADFLKKNQNGEDKGRVHLTKRRYFAMKVAVRRKSVDLKVVRVQFPLPPFFFKKLTCIYHFVYCKFQFNCGI